MHKIRHRNLPLFYDFQTGQFSDTLIPVTSIKWLIRWLTRELIRSQLNEIRQLFKTFILNVLPGICSRAPILLRTNNTFIELFICNRTKKNRQNFLQLDLCWNIFFGSERKAIRLLLLLLSVLLLLLLSLLLRGSYLCFQENRVCSLVELEQLRAWAQSPDHLESLLLVELTMLAIVKSI